MAQIQISIQGVSQEETNKYLEIFQALLKSGGLSGVRGGKTIIHFDDMGIFQGVELDYWPFRRKKIEQEVEKLEFLADKLGFKIIKNYENTYNGK